jgi:hypothetical protein
MAEKIKISWHHYTMNLSHGCTKQSPACEHCYAESYDKRKLLDSEPNWGPTAPRLFFDLEKKRKEALRWSRAAEKAGERRPAQGVLEPEGAA